MAASVNVLCPNGRRQTVKVSPNTRILEIIETVCQKQKFSADDYNLKHQRNILDVQVPFRYANVPNNAKLELVKSDVPRSRSGTTTVALQLFTGERLQHSFDSSMSLWEILEHWEGQGSDRPSLTCPQSSTGTSVHPVCIYMREEIIGEQWLKATTLRGLGLTGGRAIIRLLHREVELPPPPKQTQPKPKPKPDASTLTPPTPQSQVVSPSASQSSTSLGQSIGTHRDVPTAKSESTPAPPATVTENVPTNSELAQTSCSSETAMDCTTADNREETAMEVDSVETKSEKTSTSYQSQEYQESASISSHDEKRTVDDKSVRPKERLRPSTSKGGEEEISKEEEAEKVVKDIEKSEGLSLDEYAKRRIQSLLEKEQEMVQSMERALMESMTQQSQGIIKHKTRRPEPRPEPRPEYRAPVHPFADFKFPERKLPDRTDEGKGKEKLDAKCKPCERNQLVFSPDQDPFTMASSSDVPDEFFDLTVDDVRRMLSDLRHQSADSEKNLETKAMRDAKDQMRMRKYEKVVVRVHFPDRVILQGFFRPQETVEAVKDYVRSNLADKQQDFYLYTAPPKTILKDMSQTLFKAKLFPAAVVYFGSAVQRSHYLHEDALGDLASLLQAESVVARNMNTGITRSISSENSPGASTSSSAAASEAGPSTSSDHAGGQVSTTSQQKRQASPSTSAMGSTKVPKWFKMGKK